MPYATVQDVAARCVGLPLIGGGFTADTFVTLVQVQDWLDEAEQEVNATVESIGGASSYSDPRAESLLGQVTVLYAAAQVWLNHERAQGREGPGTIGYGLIHAYERKLESICDKPAKWLQKLNESSPGRFRSHVTHGKLGQKEDGRTRVPERLKDTGF